MTDKEKDNRVNALAMTFLEELQMRPHPFADQILRAYKAGYHQSRQLLPETHVCEDLEEAAMKICQELLEGETVVIDGYEYVVRSDAEECFKAVAKWMAEHQNTKGFLREKLKKAL